MMNKRGISGIVVAIILVLIAIMAIIILWSALRNLFEVDYDTGLLTLGLKIKSASVDENNVVDLLIKRNVGKGNLVKLKFIFENSTYSYSEINETDLKELEQKKFIFDLSGKITNITKVSIAPIIKTEKGKEILGNIVDVYTISGWTVPSTECVDNGDCPNTDCDYLDGCVGNDYYNYTDVPNNCVAGVCENNICGSPIIYINDLRCILPSPQLNITALTSDTTVNQNSFFEFKVNVSCAGGDCGEVNVSLDPSSTTIKLNSGNLTVDIEYSNSTFSTANRNYGIQEKWDISNLRNTSAISTIDDGTLCMNISFATAVTSGNLTVYYINNQTWLYSTPDSQINSMVKLNETNVTMSKKTASSISCWNVTIPLQQAYANGNSNFTLRIEYRTKLVQSITDLILGNNSATLQVGNSPASSYTGYEFYSSKSTNGASARPYLNITYTAGEVATPKLGLISTVPGTKPFYTTEANPRTINLNASQSRIVIWNINATGSLADYNFFAYANKSSNPEINDKTDIVRISII